MSERIVFTTDSPECSWQPFVEWLEQQGLDPKSVYRVDMADEGVVVVYEYVVGEDFKPIPDETGLAPAVAEPRPVAVTEPPPLHPSRRGEAAR